MEAIRQRGTDIFVTLRLDHLSEFVLMTIANVQFRHVCSRLIFVDGHAVRYNDKLPRKLRTTHTFGPSSHWAIVALSVIR